jgi:hypothetical protein
MLVESYGDIKIYRNDKELRATVYSCCNKNYLLHLLLKTNSYDEWLMGGPCDEVSRVDLSSDIIMM